MSGLTDEQTKTWVDNLLELADEIDYDNLDVLKVASLVGAARSAVVLLPAPPTNKQEASDV